MRVGHMAESYDIPVSSHLFPETSIQVLGALSERELPRIHALVLAAVPGGARDRRGRRRRAGAAGLGLQLRLGPCCQAAGKRGPCLTLRQHERQSHRRYREDDMVLTRRKFTFGTTAAAGAAALGFPRPAIAQAEPIRIGWLAAMTGRELRAGDRLQPRRPLRGRDHQRRRRRQGPQDRDHHPRHPGRSDQGGERHAGDDQPAQGPRHLGADQLGRVAGRPRRSWPAPRCRTSTPASSTA